MPSGSSPEPVSVAVPDLTADQIARLDRLAHGLDARFRLPVLGWRFGWDSVVGLIPGLGDIVTFGPALYLIYQGHKLGAQKSTLVRMGVNSGLDFVVGGVPIFGDIFDASFKANMRNVRLLKEDLSEQLQAQERREALYPSSVRA